MTLNARLFLTAFERSLAAATSLDECRKIIEDACRELGFNSLKISLAGEVSEFKTSESLAGDQYELVVPLTESDYVYLTRLISSARSILRSWPRLPTLFTVTCPRV